MGNTVSELVSYLRPPTLGEFFPNFAAIDEEIERDDFIDEILDSDKFQDYQEKFRNLKPPRDVYLDENELIMETIQPYSIQTYTFDWTESKEVPVLYELLDTLYEKYSQ